MFTDKYLAGPNGDSEHYISRSHYGAELITLRVTLRLSFSHMDSSAKFYRPELDGLRFFAFFAVLVSHVFPTDPSVYPPRIWFAVFSRLVHGGAFGVDLFFCLSAYLITELLLREKQQFGGISVKDFYIRRALRIWPLYFLMILIAAAAGVSDHSQAVPKHALVAYLVFAANWYISVHGFPHSFINPLWSISIEEQFYAVWPWMVKQFTPRGLGMLACGFLLVANLARLWLIPRGVEEHTVWTNTFTRLDPLAAGMLVAILDHRDDVHATPKQLVGLGGLALILIAALLWDANPHSLSGIYCYPLAALAVGMMLWGSMGSRWLRAKLLVELGKRSYGLYVFHAFALYLGLKMVSAPRSPMERVGSWFVSISLTVLFALLSYRYFEMPFLKLKKRFTRVRSRDAIDSLGPVASYTSM